MAAGDASIVEGDEPPQAVADNSLGRLLALSDGVFAIAMTLLALDLRLPDLGGHPSDATLRHALGDQWRSYLSFVVSFYVVANYWGTHRRAMRAEPELDHRLVTRTLLLLLLVAAIPFPASVLAHYGAEPTALAFYCVFNLAVTAAALRLLDAVRRRGTDPVADSERARLLADALVFVVCIPAAYALSDNGPWLLLLLIASGGVVRQRNRHRLSA
jgi:uncharacterized membrane protein